MILSWLQKLMNYTKRYFLPACLTILLGIWTATGSAQIQDSLFQLGEVQIVSGRLGISEARTGRHVTVIRADAIQDMPVNSIDELLRYLPFMEIQSRGAFGVQSDILMRGGSFNQMLVLLDGMRVNDPLTGHFNSYIPLSIVEIDRIEIYRGPASSVYGADAVGGVINIITRNFGSGDSVDHLEGRVEAWYGKHELMRSNSGINLKKGKWKLGAGISYNASEGHLLASDSLRGDFRLGTVSLSLAVNLSENVQLAVRSAYDNRLFNAQYFYTNSPWDLSREQVKRWWNQLQLKLHLDQSNSLTLQAAYVSTTDSFLFNPAFPANLHKTLYQQYQANHLYQSASGLRMASGLQADFKSIHSNDRGDRTHWHTGIYTMFSYTMPSELSVSAGLRLDYDEIYGIELIPQVNLGYTAGDWVLRGSAGRTIRSPDFTERFISTGLEGPLAPGRNLGNPFLVAERAWSLDAGFDYWFDQGIKLGMTGFYRFSRDLIDYIITPAEDIPDRNNLIPGQEYFFAQNIGLMNTWGLESWLSGQHSLQGETVMDWGLSYQGLLSRSDSAIVSKYLSAHARNLIQARIGIRTRLFNLQLLTMYKNRDAEIAREINQALTPDYMLWNLKADAYLWKRSLVLSFQVNNLFNRSYSDILGAGMPGRWIMGGITWKFNMNL
jgi:iron complex outermembrane receptor protein